jgi:hypothetical protein
MRSHLLLLSLLLAAGAAATPDSNLPKPAAREMPKGRLASPPVSVPPVSVPLISPMTAVPPMQVRPLPPMTTVPPMTAVPPMPVSPLPPTAPVVPLQQVAPPPVVTSCDAGGCWSSDGTRLNRVGPNLMGPGGVCTVTGKMVQCP